MNSRSFTIFELMLSVFLFSIFSILIFNFYQLTQLDGKNNIELNIASDVLFRDLVRSSKSVTDWDFKNNVFKVANAFICWTIKKQKLVRIEGDYDFISKIWSRKISSIVAKADFVSFEFIKDLNTIQFINVRLKKNKEVILIKVKPRVGPLL